MLEVDDSLKAPVLSIFGGKITTYRRLAESALDLVEERLGQTLRQSGFSKGWTGTTPLPGGDFAPGDFDVQVVRLKRESGFLPDGLATRLVRQYGTRAWRLLAGKEKLGDLGRHFGADLTQAEVDFLCANEWTRSADDILFRRSKLGLRMTAAEIAGLEAYLKGTYEQRRSA